MLKNGILIFIKAQGQNVWPNLCIWAYQSNH